MLLESMKLLKDIYCDAEIPYHVYHYLPLFVFKEALYKVKASDQRFIVLTYFDRPRLEHTVKTNFTTFQTVNPEIRSILNFLEKGLGLASPPHFVHDYSRKIFLIFCSIN